VNKTKSFYQYTDFNQNKTEAVKYFLHSSKDHLEASLYLIDHIRFFDSSAYLCHMAFECLFKALNIYENGQFEKTHNLLDLYSTLNLLTFSESSLDYIKLVNGYEYLRYPIDNSLKNKKGVIIDGIPNHPGSVEDEDVRHAGIIFKEIWVKLQQFDDLKKIIDSISDLKKSGRVLYKKEKKDKDI
jgi:HEPN domain-containing protein